MLLVKTHPVVRGIKIGSNQPPQWQSVPTPSFVFGVASNYPPSGTYQSNGYVTDANSDAITITWLTGSISGVTWDGGKFVYDGAGSVGTTGSLVLRASDGKDTTDSSAFSIEIASGLAWSSTPAPSFAEASVTPFNLGAYITNYSSATDEFRVTQGYSLPTWLSLAGTGSVNLTPSGTQVDADDVSSSPGIKIDVRRSGGAWVSSAAFGVTVYVAGSGVATWVDWSEFSYSYGVDSASVGDSTSGDALGNWFYTGQPTLASEAAWQTNNARQNDTSTEARLITPVWGGFFQPVWDEEMPLVCVVPG